MERTEVTVCVSSADKYQKFSELLKILLLFHVYCDKHLNNNKAVNLVWLYLNRTKKMVLNQIPSCPEAETLHMQLKGLGRAALHN